MRLTTALLSLAALALPASAAPYNEEYKDYNLNKKQGTQNPLEYETESHGTFTKSPANWRAVPFYTILPDKFADGDPTNNDFFGTMYEADWRETQLRFGGDVHGMMSRLDYLYSMGIRGIFMSGTPFVNQLWQADSEFGREKDASAGQR